MKSVRLAAAAACLAMSAAPALAQGSNVISAITQREKLTEVVELPTSVHPWFIGVQFHPEFRSTPWGGHPLFKSFIHAALAHQAERVEKVAA